MVLRELDDVAQTADTRYLRGMEPDALTAWIPIGDISPVGGGLMYLEDSVPLGTEIENLFKKLNADLPEEAQLDAFNENVSSPTLHGATCLLRFS